MIENRNLPALISDLPSEIQTAITTLLEPPIKKTGDLSDNSSISEGLVYAKIFQPTSTYAPEGSKLGDFYTERGILGSEISVIPLVIWNSRTKWTSGTNRSIECFSPRAERPVDNKYSQFCVDCEHQKFTKAKPSECTFHYNLLGVINNFSEVAVFQFYKTSAKIGRQIFNAIRNDPTLPIFGKTFLISTAKPIDGGAYRVIVLKETIRTKGEYKGILEELSVKYTTKVWDQIQRLEAGTVSEVDQKEQSTGEPDIEIDVPKNIV